MNYKISTLFAFIFIQQCIANPIEQTFTHIFNTNTWSDPDSKSGTGSNLYQTRIIRFEIPILLKKLGAQTLLDAPCGDFFWMNMMDLSFLNTYIGMDIVPALIENNKKLFKKNNLLFMHGDIIQGDLPQVDVILCRDCLVHLSYQDIAAAIRNFKKSGSMYLLTTTFTSRGTNGNIKTGDWRPLNLQKSPFNFPEPLELIIEGCTEANSGFADKSLGVWKISDLPNIY